MTAAVVRPAENRDLDGLVRLADAVRGVTTFPADRANLDERIAASLESFARRVVRPGAESYLFVLEEPGSDEILGCAAIIARVGGFDPFYTYEVRTERLSHEPLGIRRDLQVLHLHREHKGPTELAGLALDPRLRGRGLGRPLSLARLLFMAAHRSRFDVRCIAEMRGYQDAGGRSPFWESVGRHFFAREFAWADMLTGLGEKEFVSDLMPRHPIYVALLPQEVQDAIGRVHPDAEPARHLLEDEGFAFAGEVDIFDAGPLLAAPVEAIRTVREARFLPLAGEAEEDDVAASTLLVASGGTGFRATTARAREVAGGLLLAPGAADRLGVSVGDLLVVAPPSPRRTAGGA